MRVTTPEQDRLLGILIAISCCAWLAISLGTGRFALPVLCTAQALWTLPSAQRVISLFQFVSPIELIVGWLAMVLAMMVPTQAAALIHIHRTSFRKLRTQVTMLYLTGYVGAWVLAAPLLLVVALTLRLVIPIESLAIWFAALAAVMWQISPLKQTLLNRCHARPDLDAFAPAAQRSAFKAGIDAATWCIGTCGAVMVVALSTPVLHVPIMILAALWIWMERVEPARRPRWGFSMPTALYRLLVVLAAGRFSGRVVG